MNLDGVDAAFLYPSMGCSPVRCTIRYWRARCAAPRTGGSGRNAPASSHDARMKHVDPLPGGLNSTPEQDALARTAGGARVQSSLEKGVSFTLPIAPNVPVLPPPYQVEKAVPTDTARHQPVFTGRPAPASRPVPVRVAFPEGMAQDAPAAAHPESQAQPIRVAAAGDPKAEEAYSKQFGDLFSQWGGGHRTPTSCCRPPRRTAPEPPAMRRRPRASGCGVTQGAAAGARRLPCG